MGTRSQFARNRSDPPAVVNTALGTQTARTASCPKAAQ
jgi:hypothetical protein